MKNLKLSIEAAQKNSKQISHVVRDQDGYQLGMARASDLEAFVDAINAANDAPLAMVKLEGYENLLKGVFGVRWEYRGFKAYERCTLYIEGDKVTIAKSATCLSASYDAPEAFTVVGEDGLLRTDRGDFRIVEHRGHLFAEKVEA